MTLTLKDVKKATNLLFTSDFEADKAFEREPFVDELKRAIAYVNDGNTISLDFFNRVLTASLLGPIDGDCFNRYFPIGINSFEKLEEGILKFVKDALMHFGSLHQAFTRIKANYSTLPASEKTFGSEERSPFNLSRSISHDKLAYLGYVSGELPLKMTEAHKIILSLIDDESIETIDADLLVKKAKQKGVDLEEQLERVNKGLTARNEPQVTMDEFINKKDDIKKSIDNFITEVKQARSDGLKNLEQYINVCNDMDVYVATSMRDDKDYRDMNEFVDHVFNRKDIHRLNLRYFDPTQAYCPNKYDKGLVECLMIRCSKVTIYCAQKQDTMGKDSELAITLGQGKPVIAYIPQGKEYDRRAEVFSDVHPLSLQVDQRTGNSNGIIVVRTADQCADVLYALAKGRLTVDVSREESIDTLSGQRSVFWVLREAVTGNRSVIRVVSGWHHLRTAFWSAYRPDLHIP